MRSPRQRQTTQLGLTHLELAHREDRGLSFFNVGAGTMNFLRPKLLQLSSLTELRDEVLRVLMTAAEIFDDLEKYVEPHLPTGPRTKQSRARPMPSEVTTAIRLLYSNLTTPGTCQNSPALFRCPNLNSRVYFVEQLAWDQRGSFGDPASTGWLDFSLVQI